jgi:tetratricopeptide (TPR) repeat protein
VPAEEVFNRTRMGVLRATQGEQNPSNYSSLNEDFTFGPQVRAREQLGKVEQPPVGPFSKPIADVKKPSVGQDVKEPPVGQDVKEPPAGPDSKPIPDIKDLDAIKDLDRKLQNNPSDAAAFYRRGQLYAKIADYSKAIKDFDEALRLRPVDAEALNNRCWARAMVGDFQTALHDCNEALQLLPRYADALDSRGLVKLKIGLPSSAIADYDAALQIKQQASSLYGRGIAKKQTGNTAEGDSDIAAAKALDPIIAAEFAREGIR